MSFWTIFGLIILILIILIWIIHNLYKNGRMPDGAFKETYENMLYSGRKTYDNYFTDAINLYERTIGYENDDTAKMAMTKALKKEEMYSKNELNGRLSKKKYGKAAMNSFMIADLYRFNVSPNQKTKEDYKISQIKAALFYNRTLNRIKNNPVAIIENQTNLQKFNSKDYELPPEFMIDRAEDFYEDYIAHIINEEPSLTQQPNFDEIRTIVRDARVKVSQKATTKPDVLKTYYSEKSIPNDPQNVHDSQISNDVQNIFNKIVEKNNQENGIENQDNMNKEKNKEPTLEDIRNEINQYKFSSPTHKDRALLILRKFSEKNTYSNLNTTEDQILLNIWKRIHSPENVKNKDELKASLFDSMADSMDVDNYGVYKEVCLQGRCNRILQSLTLLDQDNEISQPIKTTEILKNEIFSKSYKIIQDELKTVSPEIADIYNGKITSKNAELIEKVELFENNVKDKIEKTIREDHSNVKSSILDDLIKDAQAGV